MKLTGNTGGGGGGGGGATGDLLGAGHLVEDLNQCLALFDSMGMDIADVAGQGLGALANAPVASFSLAG